MPDTLLPLEPDTPAAEICAQFDMGEDAEALVADGLTADQYFQLLQKKKLYFDAIRMLAVVLHKLYGVEWAYTAAGSEMNENLTDDDKVLLDVTDQWLNAPDEANRRIAMEAAEAGGYETPACWTAAAVGWTGGSLAPADLPVVPPGDDLTSKAVTGAISMIAVQNSAQIEKRAAQLVDLGLEFAARRPVPEPLYTGAAPEKPADSPPPPEKPKFIPPPVVPKPAAPAPQPQRTVLNPPPPKFVPPKPKPSAPPPPPPSSPGTWSTDPL